MAVEYRIDANNRVQAVPSKLQTIDPSVLWIDVVSPNDIELVQLEHLMGFELPNRSDMVEIELSNRLYKEDDGSLVMIASMIPKSDAKAGPTRPATFILKDDLLLTIRYSEFFSFERVAVAVLRNTEKFDSLTLFCRLLEEAVSDRADSLEFSMRRLELLASQMFAATLDKKTTKPESPELDQTLAAIGTMGEMVSNVRESITSLQRVVNFARWHISPEKFPEVDGLMDSLKNDMAALSDEASFFMNKINFNLDATLGMINIEETKVMRLLSIVTLLLSPPTLIAGIYGMNFEIMPELAWPLGYIFSLGLMATTAVVSIIYLKRRKWM
jgi:Mg2+ and Co2+ transporters